MAKRNSKSNLSSSLLIVCALRPEAKPFMAEYKLKQVISEHGFHLLTNEDLGISLLITGQGKVKTAAAMMWVHSQSRFIGYLNVGVVGHGSADIGQGMLVNKVFDQSTNERYYPMRVFKSTIETTSLVTVDQPSDEYSENIAYDMETSAFLQVARLFVPVEMAQSYKVVSDNPSSSYERITADLINDLLTPHIVFVTELSEKMKQCKLKTLQVASESNELMITTTINDMQKQWHVTASQLIQLKQSLQNQLIKKPILSISKPMAKCLM